jgi:hypothetical protein
MSGTKELAVVTLHGMGEQKPDYANGLRDGLAKRLKADFARVHFEPVFFQDLVQPFEDAIWKRMQSEHRLDSKGARKYLLFSFADASTLEHAPAWPDGPYLRVQRLVRDVLGRVFDALDRPDRRLVVIAHSLGCQVLSNYAWDSDHDGGVWKHFPLAPGTPAARIRFQKLATKRLFLTSGCNIPLFVCGLKEITPIARDPADFRWINSFDPDDALGWPLGPLSPAYAALVEDHSIDVGSWLTSWNLFSHTGYWDDDDFLRPAAKHIRALLP